MTPLAALVLAVVCKESPCYVQAKVPVEGNYRVTVTFGDSQAAGSTSVKAELRRLMVERVDTRKGEFVTRTFIVNTRTPKRRDTSTASSPSAGK